MLPIGKIADKVAQRAKKPINDAPVNKVVYVAPMPPELPDDGILVYQQIAGVYELKDVADRSVCLFSTDELAVLRCITEHQNLFGVETISLLGLPKAEYGPAFDEIVWNLERVGYAAFVSELALAIESRANTEAANATVHDRERATYVRASGEVKKHQALVIPAGDVADDSELDED